MKVLTSKQVLRIGKRVLNISLVAMVLSVLVIGVLDGVQANAQTAEQAAGIVIAVVAPRGATNALPTAAQVVSATPPAEAPPPSAAPPFEASASPPAPTASASAPAPLASPPRNTPARCRALACASAYGTAIHERRPRSLGILMSKVTALGMDVITEKSGHAVGPVAPSVCNTPVGSAVVPIPYPVTGTSAEGLFGTPSRTKIGGAKVGTVGGGIKAVHGN